ncbi:MAG: hypothetical protein K2V38_09310 [Gemmataceae bacterium]|nr:hypothetical protein [Gemmataceae bacterium]
MGVRDLGEKLAPALPDTLRTLRIEDWPFPADAAAVARANLPHLENLSVWLTCMWNDEDVCRALAESFPALKRFELVQLRGCMHEDRGPHDDLADDAATVVNAIRGAPVGVVWRPFDCLFPLAEQVGYGFESGLAGDGRQVFALCGALCQLVYFDHDGHFLSSEVLDLTGELREQPDQPWGRYNRAELHTRLHARIGFGSAMIRVREFNTGDISVYKFGREILAWIEETNIAVSPGEHETRLDLIRYFLHSTNFCIANGNEYWADGRGVIHSS